MRLLTYIALPEDEGKKVRQLLRGPMQLSYTLLQSLKWQPGAILLNGSPCHMAAIVHSGDCISADVEDHRALSDHIAPVELPLDILWEDEDLLILHKPAGIAVHSAALTEETVTVAGAVSHYLGGGAFHPVNRLDKGVTGIMVVAKNGHCHDLCMRQLHTDRFRREYYAVTLGVPDPPSGHIDLPIGRDTGSAVRRCIAPDGSEAHTVYKVEKICAERALVRLRPLTGRTHQLRLHMASIGCPLAGDWLYGTEDHALIDRPALHSCELWFTHPIRGDTLHFSAPLPQDMADLI